MSYPNQGSNSNDPRRHCEDTTDIIENRSAAVLNSIGSQFAKHAYLGNTSSAKQASKAFQAKPAEKTGLTPMDRFLAESRDQRSALVDVGSTQATSFGAGRDEASKKHDGKN